MLLYPGAKRLTCDPNTERSEAKCAHAGSGARSRADGRGRQRGACRRVARLMSRRPDCRGLDGPTEGRARPEAAEAEIWGGGNAEGAEIDAT